MAWGGSWFALRGVSVERAMQALQMRGTGRLVDEREIEPLVGGLLENGWYVIFSSNDSDISFFKDQLEELSKGGEGVHGSFEEHAMGSSAAYYRDGQQVWLVMREAGGPYAPLTVEGDPPPSFAERKTRLFRQQEEDGGKEAGVDYIYDLPIELAEEAAGFSHENSFHRLGFEVLEYERPQPAPPLKRNKPWWKVW